MVRPRTGRQGWAGSSKNYKITFVEWRIAHADREIEPFVDDVYEAVRAFEYHLDIGVRLQETSDHFPDLERDQ